MLLAPDLYTISADELQIEQVIINLVLNSRDHPRLEPGSYAMMAVTDSCHGIDAETNPHLFEPFYTTKEQGKGTGMGLASAYGIIKQSGGFIEVASELGLGSTFTLYFPSVGEAEPAPVTGSEQTIPQDSSEATPVRQE